MTPTASDMERAREGCPECCGTGTVSGAPFTECFECERVAALLAQERERTITACLDAAETWTPIDPKLGKRARCRHDKHEWEDCRACGMDAIRALGAGGPATKVES